MIWLIIFHNKRNIIISYYFFLKSDYTGFCIESLSVFVSFASCLPAVVLTERERESRADSKSYDACGTIQCTILYNHVYSECTLQITYRHTRSSHEWAPCWFPNIYILLLLIHEQTTMTITITIAQIEHSFILAAHRALRTCMGVLPRYVLPKIHISTRRWAPLNYQLASTAWWWARRCLALYS